MLNSCIHTTFGYINTIDLVGIGLCNNPFYSNPNGTVHAVIAGNNDIDRSALARHMYTFAEGVISAIIPPMSKVLTIITPFCANAMIKIVLSCAL